MRVSYASALMMIFCFTQESLGTPRDVPPLGSCAEQAERIEAAPAAATRKASPKASRPARREADIPMGLLDRAYTPPATSSKASFRSDGSDHQQDQELTPGNANERWNDEDHYTNKSGDPRIGTHRRTYEPGETRAEPRD